MLETLLAKASDVGGRCGDAVGPADFDALDGGALDVAGYEVAPDGFDFWVVRAWGSLAREIFSERPT